MRRFKLRVADNKFNENGSKYLVRLIHKIQLLFENDEVQFPDGETDDNHNQDDESSCVHGWELWTLKPKLWASQIWTLIHLINNFVIVLVCSKCSKLITLEENIVSVQQHPLCLPLFFGFVSEVLNRGMKSCFDGVIFQDAVWEECFSIPLRCLHLQYFLTVFMRVLSLKSFS